MAYPEDQDIRSGKAPKHQAAAKKHIQSDLSNADIRPMKDKFNEAFPLLQEARKILQALQSKSVPIEVQTKWIDRATELNFGAIAKRVNVNKQTKEDIKTLKMFIAEAEKGLGKITVEKRTRAKSEKEMEKQYLSATLSTYEIHARDLLVSLGSKSASEWEVTGFNDLGEKASGTCHLCGHAPIRYEYIITKMSGKHKGVSLKVGSECVVNYMHIPLGDVKELARKFEFERQNDPENIKVQLETLLDRVNRMTDLPTARKHNQWEIYHKWKGKDATIKKSIEMLEENGLLTKGRLQKMLDMLKDVLQDEKLIDERLIKIQESKEEEMRNDPLLVIMQESKPFHEQNSFLKDIYEKWVRRYTLSERQISAFKSALDKEKRESAYNVDKMKEFEGINTVKGIITGFNTGSVIGKKGIFNKITFDIISSIGVVTGISIVEWDEINFYQIQELIDDEEHTITVKYELKDGRWRNLTEVVETDKVYETTISVPDPTLDTSIFRGLDPRNWQSAHFMTWWNARRGIVQAGTGAGKTKFAIMAVLKMLDEKPDAKIVIAVPTMELQKQWKRELKMFGIKPTLVGGGHGKEFGQITIGIYNTLWEKKIVADLLIGDEAHHLSSNTNMNVGIWKNNLDTIDRILFLTATPGRHLMGDMPVIAVISQEELQAEGSLAHYSVTNLFVRMGVEDTNRYNQLTSLIVENTKMYGEEHIYTKMVSGERYRWITNHENKIEGTATLVRNLVNESKRVIIFCTMIENMYIIKEAINVLGLDASIVHSSNPDYKMPAKIRKQNLEDFASDKTQVLIGGPALSEGIDIPSASVCIILGGSSQEREYVQRSGRVLRVTPNKDTAEIFQIYMKETMEQTWVKSRLKSIARGTSVSDYEMEDYLKLN